jgi:hypothetical protein
MKTRSLLSLLLFLFSYSGLQAQDEKSPTVEFLNKRRYIFPTTENPHPNTKWPDTLHYNTAYRATLLGSPTIPISFSRVEMKNGSYEVSPTISIGYGYTWFWGQFIFHEDDKIVVDPKVNFGLVADVALQNDFDLKKPAGLFVGGFVGVTAFSLFFGYDVVARSPTLGLGGRIDVYTLSQNSLRPVGKVREVRRHKRAATVITNE